MQDEMMGFSKTMWLLICITYDGLSDEERNQVTFEEFATQWEHLK